MRTDWHEGCAVCSGALGKDEAFVLNPPGGYGRPGLWVHSTCARKDPGAMHRLTEVAGFREDEIPAAT